MKHEPRQIMHSGFQQFMQQNRSNLDHLTAPQTGLSHEGEFEILLNSLIVIPVSSETQKKKGALLMFCDEQWEVHNDHWEFIEYRGQYGIRSILIIGTNEEDHQGIVLRAKVLVFKFMWPKMYHPNDHKWKQIEWTTGGIYKPKTSVVIPDFKTTSRL